MAQKFTRVRVKLDGNRPICCFNPMTEEALAQLKVGPQSKSPRNVETPRQPHITRVRIGFEGVTPLLMSLPFDLFSSGCFRRSSGGGISIVPPPRSRAQKSRRELAEEELYIHKGRIGIPVDWLCSALTEAGREVKLEGRKKISTATSTHLFQFLFIEEEGGNFIPLQRGAQWKPDVRRGIRFDRTALAIVRPRFDSWRFSCTIQVREDRVSLETVRDLFDVAGELGLGDFRPAVDGRFGQFKIVRWKVLHSAKEDVKVHAVTA